MPSIDIRDEATPALARVTGALRREVGAAIGRAVVKLFQRNFRSLPDNKHGWPTTNFWERAARATNYDLLGAGVAINVNQIGVRQRLEGGEIHAKGGGYLTIPARAEAYGKRASDFNNLHVAFFKTGHGFFAALVEAQATNISFGRQRADGSRKVKAESTGGGVMFWLVKSVNQAANPDVIPSQFEIAAVCFSTTNDIVDRAIARGGRG